MNASYDPALVLLSYVVAVLASFVALDLAARVSSSLSPVIARIWLGAGATAMGLGIWSMHFVGMLAFRLPIPVSYNVPITLLSLLFAIAASAFALHALKGGELSPPHLLRAGVVMGMGIVAMHYTGMAAMELRPWPHYNRALVAASVLIAVAASLAALWIAGRLRHETILSARWRKAGSAMVMALAIAGMHYTAMTAAAFDTKTICYGSPSMFGHVWLAATVGLFTLLFLIATLLVAVFDARLAERTAALTLSGHQNAALEARVLERTQEIRASERALQQSMREATQAKERAETAYADLQHAVETRQQLEDRVRELGSLLDIATDAIIICALDRRILYWNHGAEALYGWTAEEAVSRRIDELLFADAATFRSWKTAVQGSGEMRGRLRLLRKDGSTVMVEGHSMLVRTETGAPKSVFSIGTDITRRLAMEEQLQQSQRLESVGQLTGGVAHDFNNLLTVILGNAELLVEQLETQPRLRMLAEMVRTAAQRGADLTHQLLAFARRQTLEAGVVDVGALLAGMEPLLRRALSESVTIKQILAADLRKAVVDPAQLENAILNLCLNARDAMPNGGLITIRAENAQLDADYAASHPDAAVGAYVRIVVSDTGQGISPENLKHVFEPFFTTKPFGKGTGLGLSMVYGFVKQSQGHVAIYSEPGHGTSIKLYLPMAPEAAEAPVPPTQRETEVHGTETVLLVEDEELLRSFAVNQLRTLGYQVIAAADGKAALAVIGQGQAIDLLFTDVVMPGMNGAELAQKARALRPSLKVLYTSGYTDNAVLDNGEQEGAPHFLAKPYRRVELAQKLRLALAS